MDKSILYWKWDETIFEEGALEAGARDIVSRSGFELVYVSFHHLGRPYDDSELFEKITEFSQILRENGRKLLLDVDIRTEMATFRKFYPNSEAGSVLFYELRLDHTGSGCISAKHRIRGRTGRSIEDGAGTVLRAWAFDATGRKYLPESLVPINVDTKTQGTMTEYSVSAGRENAGKLALVAVWFGSAIPDPFSDDIYPFYRQMLEYFCELDCAGVANDEWGYDLYLNRNDNGLFSVRAFPYTQAMEKKFFARFGKNLANELIHFAYLPKGSEVKAYSLINEYLDLMRAQMKENNDWFYDTGKLLFGPDAFIGVHPTFWGDYDDCGIDILHNGLDWWEVKRDIAQTDEFVIMPIRLALAHKWGGNTWYNMWYSGNTQQPATFYMESWNNLRFGGRTHYLGYECPNEPGVYNLKNPNGLELAWKMEQRISEASMFLESQPDSSVLVVFGMQAATNWLYAYGEPKVTRSLGRFPHILRFAANLFEHCVCDLVPSTEIKNGSIRREGAYLRYGTQQYEAVIFIEPEFSEPEVLDFFADYQKSGGKLIIGGSCACFSDGEPADQAFRALCENAVRYDPELTVAKTVLTLQKLKVPKNLVPNGCLFQDGTMVFTAAGIAPTGNFLQVDCEFNGHRVRFSGEDYLILKRSANCSQPLILSVKVIELAVSEPKSFTEAAACFEKT